MTYHAQDITRYVARFLTGVQPRCDLQGSFLRCAAPCCRLATGDCCARRADVATYHFVQLTLSRAPFWARPQSSCELAHMRLPHTACCSLQTGSMARHGWSFIGFHFEHSQLCQQSQSPLCRAVPCCCRGMLQPRCSVCVASPKEHSCTFSAVGGGGGGVGRGGLSRLASNVRLLLQPI